MDIASIEQLDRQLTLFINSWNSAATDPVMWFFSDKKVWIPMYAAIIAMMFWKMGWKRTLVMLVSVALTVLFCDQFANLIKHWVQRIRPVNDESMIAQGLHVLEYGGGFSFFSAHAANAFGVACCTIPVLRKYANGKRLFGRAGSCSGKTGLNDASAPYSQSTGAERCSQSSLAGKPDIWARCYTAWMLIWAFMVSISRIFVGKHFLGDVIVGIIIGIIFGLLMAEATLSVIRKLEIQ